MWWLLGGSSFFKLYPSTAEDKLKKKKKKKMVETWKETFLRYLSLEAVWDTIFQLARSPADLGWCGSGGRSRGWSQRN